MHSLEVYGVVFTVAIVEVARVGDVGDGTVSGGSGHKAR